MNANRFTAARAIARGARRELRTRRAAVMRQRCAAAREHSGKRRAGGADIDAGTQHNQFTPRATYASHKGVARVRVTPLCAARRARLLAAL